MLCIINKISDFHFELILYILGTESVVQNNIFFEQYHTPAHEASCIHGSDASSHISPQEKASFLYHM